MLKFYKHNEIDFEKWDELILKSPNGVVYAMAWFLNIINPGWTALVFEVDNDYKAAVPLLERKKWGLFPFHPNPPLAQRLGLIHCSPENEKSLLKETIIFLKSRYVLLKYPFNNILSGVAIAEEEVYTCRNYILNLNKTYNKLFIDYRRDRKARLKQARQAGLKFRYSKESPTLLSLFSSEVVNKINGGVSKKTLRHIVDIAEYVIDNQCGFIAEIADENNKVISAALFLRFKNRILYIISATDREGKIKQANTLLLDQVILSYAEKPIILDFEGSHIAGIADFYASFGAEIEHYSLITYTNLMFQKMINLKKK